jgi:TRAP-type C4-dicarboxylate transport system permease small subunit
MKSVECSMDIETTGEPVSITFVRIGSIIRKISAAATIVVAMMSSVAILIMVVMGTADVIGTKVFNSPLPATVEATETLLVVLLFGGLAYAQLQGRQIRVELLVNKFSPRMKLISAFTGNLIGAVFFIILTYYCIFQFWDSWLIRESAASIFRFPIYPAKLFMVIGGGIMTLQLVVDVVVEARSLMSRQPVPEA